MNEEQLIDYIAESNIVKRWHWFGWHFRHLLAGAHHPMAQDIVDVCLEVEERIPGFALRMVDALASISGREKYEPHWEQLLQRLAEIHVIRQFITYAWPFPASFQWEPMSTEKTKNVELAVRGGAHTLGIEVKAPSLLEHIRERGSNPVQLPTRYTLSREDLAALRAREPVTPPRDNPVKKFLVSADQKFAGFKRDDPHFRGLLVIVWDQYMYEPMSSMLHRASGLFTPASFTRGPDGGPRRFPNVDGVVLISHLHQLMRSTRDNPFVDGCASTFDYGVPERYPPKVIVVNPHGEPIPGYAVECLQAIPSSPMMGAEYDPSDMVFWIKF